MGCLSVCPELVTGPKELVAGLGSCLYIPCRYDLCLAGPEAQLRKLYWLHHPYYDKKKQEFTGQKVSSMGEFRDTPRTNQGDCSLILPRVQANNAGTYGLRLVADPSRGSYKGLLWMHTVTINVTDTPTLVWEGPVTNTPGVHMDAWTPPATVTSNPAIGTRLTFEPLWYHDKTFLECVLQGSDGKIITRASRQLQVNYAPRDVQVEMTPSSPVHEGREVTLSCRDTAKPPSHTYTWRLGDRILPHRTAQVLLRPIQATDGGSYRCQATNTVGTIESLPTTLEVYYAPRDVRVEVTPSSPIHEGQEVTLSCRDSSKPPSHTYTWSLEGRILPHRTAQVHLRPTNVTDGGSYSCQATNALGTAESPPTTLEVYYPPRAAILENLTALPALVASRITLHCALGPAHPAPSFIQWLRNDCWEADTLGPTLSFNADPARAGAYRCIGQNPAGSTFSLPLSVIVWYPPKAVQVLQSPGGPVVAGGGPVRLRCQIGAAEPPKFTVSWFKNGQELPGPAPDLLLPGPEPADAAAYACQARNEVGVARSPPVTLDVRWDPGIRAPQKEDPGIWAPQKEDPGIRPPPKIGDPGIRAPQKEDPGIWAPQKEDPGIRLPPKIRDPVGPQGVELVLDPGRRVQEATDVTLRCRAAARPPPSAFEWFWEERPLGRTPEGLWVLRAVKTQASGRYRCRVTNDIATADSSDVIVTVYYSTATILQRTFLGLGVGLSILLVLGTLGCFLRRRWRRQTATDEEPAVEPSRTFFLCNKMPRIPGSPRPPPGPDDADAINYSSLLSLPGSGSVPRLQGDTVVYTVLKKNDGAAKATEGSDYENVPPGSSNRDRDRDGDRDGTLVYAALALFSPGTSRGHAGDVGDTVEYATLRQ
ncbi:B-cell receptor CD22 [Aptenodytes patagonicus]|uniref:B-cell receptor CD22 n=1 Tax=Aptenodytes patagonicus TaxID=9234 RepID=UPI003FA03442